MGVTTNCIDVSNFQKTKKEKTENRYLENDFNLERKMRLPMETEGTGRRVGSKSEQTIPGSWWRNEFQGPSTNQCQTLLRGWGNEDLWKGHWPVQYGGHDDLDTMLKQAEQDFKVLKNKEMVEEYRRQELLLKKLNNKGEGSWVTWRSSGCKGSPYWDGNDLTGLKGEQTWPAEKEKDKTEDVERRGRRPEPGPRRLGRYYYLKNINQQVTTGSSERREQEMHEGESTQKSEMVRKNAEEALVRESWGLFWKIGVGAGDHLL